MLEVIRVIRRMSGPTEVHSRRRSAGTYHEAMTICPDARRMELQYPVALAQPQNGEVMIDFPSAGGYIKPYLHAVAPGCAYCAVEHSPEYEEAGLDVTTGTWQKLNFDDHSVNIVLCLAALHHVYPGRNLFYQECSRVLGAGGRLIIGDVAEGTNAGRFLNEFVDTYSPEGHKAQFFRKDIDIPEIESAGFKVSHWEVRDLRWYYPDKKTAIIFCRGLFRLGEATDKQVWEGLNNYLGINETNSGVEMGWQLAFIRANNVL
jgi:SAM-dependent methyltransferase